MDLYKMIPVFLFAFLLQVGALSSEFGAQKADLILADGRNPFLSLKKLYVNTRTTIDKLQNCGPRTHFEIFALAAEKVGDYRACVNATREIAEYEDFLFHMYDYSKFVASTILALIKDILNCRHESGLFTILNCTVSEIQVKGPEFDEILSKAEDLIGEVKNDTDNLVYYIKSCFGRSSNSFISDFTNLIQKC